MSRHHFENPKNACTACGQDFAGITYFDKHRVGTFDYAYSAGLKLEPPREDGRRCLTRDEMTAKGWALNKDGRWADPTASERLAHAHGKGS